MSKDRRRVKRDLNRLLNHFHKDHKLNNNNVWNNRYIIRDKLYLTEKNCCKFFGWF